MSFPRAQGNGREMPDGYLHLNNYSHVMASGIAGSIFERVMSKRQQEIVERILLERCGHNVLSAEPVDGLNVIFKHNVYRFRKTFLHENFKDVVYATLKASKKPAGQVLSMAATKELLEVLGANHSL